MSLSTKIKNSIEALLEHLEEKEISAYVIGRKINFWRLLRKLIELFL